MVQAKIIAGSNKGSWVLTESGLETSYKSFLMDAQNDYYRFTIAGTNLDVPSARFFVKRAKESEENKGKIVRFLGARVEKNRDLPTYRLLRRVLGLTRNDLKNTENRYDSDLDHLARLLKHERYLAYAK